MPSVSQGPQQFRDRIAESHVHCVRDKFIERIYKKDVCRLASAYNEGITCDYFKDPVRGSYNICYFVQFDAPSVKRWVVRVPLAPCLAFGARNKLESEIATMQLIAERTSIPIPKIHAFAMDDTHEPLSSFLILEYVDGKTLSSSQLRALPNEQRIRLYNSLADVYIQLRRLEFPSIGCLIRRPDSFEVCKRTTTIDINMQELEGLHPSQIQVSYYGKDGRLTSANDYVTMLLAIGYNAFIEGRSSVVEKQEGEDALYHLDIFQQYAEQWKDGCLDQGPFALVHGDLELHNLLVNEDGDILSVLDWEWSRVVPLQFFKPPLWLGNSDTTNLAYNFMYQDYTKKFNQLLDTIRIREKQRYGDTMLADEWAVAKADSGFLVANALENWTDMDWFAHRYINWKLYRKIDLNKRVEAFMEEDPARVDLIERKVREGADTSGLGRYGKTCP